MTWEVYHAVDRQFGWMFRTFGFGPQLPYYLLLLGEYRRVDPRVVAHIRRCSDAGDLALLICASPDIATVILDDHPRMADYTRFAHVIESMGILRRGEVLTIDGTGLSRQLPRYAQQRAGAVETGRRVFTLRVNRHFIFPQGSD